MTSELPIIETPFGPAEVDTSSRAVVKVLFQPPVNKEYRGELIYPRTELLKHGTPLGGEAKPPFVIASKPLTEVHTGNKVNLDNLHPHSDQGGSDLAKALNFHLGEVSTLELEEARRDAERALSSGLQELEGVSIPYIPRFGADEEEAEARLAKALEELGQEVPDPLMFSTPYGLAEVSATGRSYATYERLHFNFSSWASWALPDQARRFKVVGNLKLDPPRSFFYEFWVKFADTGRTVYITHKLYPEVRQSVGQLVYQIQRTYPNIEQLHEVMLSQQLVKETREYRQQVEEALESLEAATARYEQVVGPLVK